MPVDKQRIIIKRPELYPFGGLVEAHSIITAFEAVIGDPTGTRPLSIEERIVYSVLHSVYGALARIEKEESKDKAEKGIKAFSNDYDKVREQISESLRVITSYPNMEQFTNALGPMITAVGALNVQVEDLRNKISSLNTINRIG